MAPGRKRGASSKGKATTELSLGDLVLAKVKGFPAWPAKVSRPEDWERTPDPTKYFVQFFGTQETAFVSPEDIQTFTNESRSKLRSKCKGKTIKFFPQAVDEICEACKELEQKKVGVPGDDVVCKPHVSSTIDGMKTNGVRHESLAIADAAGSGSSLERCSGMLEGIDTKKINSADEIKLAKEGVSKCNLATPSHVKVETVDRKKKKDVAAPSQCTESGRATSSSPYSSASPSPGNGLISRKRDVSTPSGSAIRKRAFSGKQKALTEAHKSRKLEFEQMRMPDSAVGHSYHAKSSGHQKDETPRKISSGNGNQEPSPANNGLDRDSSGLKVHRFLKEKTPLDIANYSQKDAVCGSEDYAELDHPKQLNNNLLGSERRPFITSERSDPSKRTKNVNLVSDSTKSCSLRNGKRDSSSLINPCVLLEKKSENKRLHMEAEGQMESKPQKVSLVSNVPGDGAVSPSAKWHHGIVSSDMANSSVTASDDKRSLLSSFPRSDVTKKRRAIRLDDDDEDDIRKTPVHGFSTRKSIPSSLIPDSSRTKVQIEDTVDKSEKVDPQSPAVLDTDKQLLGELVSQEKSSCVVSTSDKELEEQSGKRHQAKLSGNLTTKKSGHISSGEKPKVTSKSQREGDFVASVRVDDVRKDLNSSSWDSKTTDSETSIKNLIAAAQAKRRLAQIQSLSQSNIVSITSAIEHVQVKNSSPSAGQQSITDATNLMQVDAQPIHSLISSTSPSDHAPEFVSLNHDKEEHDDKRPSLGHQGGGSLSGGTETGVARDAFEGMIETLSRTKESIGRATRLAVDCAKYGIAGEVVDLLIRKLESESSLHRKVDLFFLVDSITQCSHNQKGIAGASYIPAVQVALPRLLGAAAPAGANARENRRQCQKVLRLWLERKILPESLLRRCMDDIGASNDDSSSVLSYRRPSRAERAVDDPLREMEGMLVDEYGSNATFQLPGIFSSHAFDDNGEDEEDILGTSCIRSAEGVPVEGAPSCMGVAEEVPLDPVDTVRESDVALVTPNDKHHHILEDVDVELEMEDVSGHQKDEIALSSRGLSVVKHGQSLEGQNDQTTYDDAEALTPEGSPPLPFDPPPPQPPLPVSPPPLPPLTPPPPPPPPSSQPHLTSLPPLGLSSSIHPPLPPQSSLPQPPGNQMVQLAVSAPQQSACFIQAGTNGPLISSAYNASRPSEYGQSDMYVGSLPAQPNQQFQPTHITFPRGSFVPPPPPQTHGTSSQFTFIKPAVQQHVQHQYPHSYSSQSFLDNRTRIPADEHWGASGEYITDNQHVMWINSGRAPSYSTKPFGAEGYYLPPSERPPSSNMGFPAPNSAQAGYPTPGHNNSQITPSRPDMSAHNGWRPA